MVTERIHGETYKHKVADIEGYVDPTTVITAHKAEADAHTAANITNVPAGDIAAVTVQAALNELDSEKVSKSGSLTQITTRNHADLQTPNADANYQHLTTAEVADITLKSGSITQITTRNHNDLQAPNADVNYQHLTTAEVANITLKSGSLTQITTRNHADLQNLNAGSAHPSASIDNTSTSYGRGLATTDNTVQKIADRVNQNGTPQFVTDKTKCSLLLDFKGTLADRSRAINPIDSDAANKWTDNFVNDSTTKTSATNISCTLKQFEGDEGKFGSGIAVEESRTNLVLNSQDSSQAVNRGGVQATNIASPVGNKGCHLVTDGNGTGAIQYNTGALAANTTYTVSFWVKGSINLISSSLLDNNYNNMSDLVITGITQNWKRLSVTFTTNTNSGTSGFLIIGYYSPTGTFDIDGVQLEAGAFPSSYIATGATAVTRPAGKMNFDPNIINNNQGSISFWYKANYNYDDAGTVKVLLNNWVVADNSFNLQYNTSEDKFSLDYIKNGSLYQIKSSAQTSDFNNHIFHIVVKWTSTDYYLYIDNVLIGSVGNLDIGITTLFSLGYYTNIPRYCCNGTISNFAIFNYALSDAEISQIYNSGLEGKPVVCTNPESIIGVGQTLHDPNFITFTSGWGISSTYPNKPTLSKSSNVALMRGILEYSGVVNSDVTLFTLPVGARPSLPDTYYHSFVTTARDSGSPAMRILRVYGNGDVKLMASGATITNPALSLDNINFVNGK